MAKIVGKISHKKSLSLSIKQYDNRITKLNIGSFKKVCILHNGIFHHIFLVKLGQFYSIIFPVIVTKNKKLKTERKEDIFAYMTVSVYHVISSEIENHLSRHN